MTSSAKLPDLHNLTVAVIGLGYVGLPIAVAFASTKICRISGNSLNRRVIGFDINEERIQELSNSFDRNLEVSSTELSSLQNLLFTSTSSDLVSSDIFIVTVPTPVDSSKRPDLTCLRSASDLVGSVIKNRTQYSLPIVIFESTVFPGATEEVCIPIIESVSNLTLNHDFFCGYSPERINPGESNHKLQSVVKVTSGSSPDASLWIDQLYGSVIDAGTYKASSIKVAEAAKVIENTQRDLNIALVNELSMIFSLMDIDTIDVLNAASTKWNFLPFRPGLVGGHCIGVDPYYLTYKSEQLGYLPQVVLAGRRINDGMGRWIVDQLILVMARRGFIISHSNILILGFSFKENCPDFRNTRVIDIVNSVKYFGMSCEVVDPWVSSVDSTREYGLAVLSSVPSGVTYDAVIVAVQHKEFVGLSSSYWRSLLTSGGVLVDLKGIVPRELNALRP